MIAEQGPAASSRNTSGGGVPRRVNSRGILLVALAAAAFLRLFQLTSNPPELFEDEVSGAASIWSLATTGHDVIATHLPFLMTRLGPQHPLYYVFTLPLQALLGQQLLAVRLPAALFGIADVALLYALLRVLGAREQIALGAAAFFAILPWSVSFGRVGWDQTSYPPFLLLGLVLLTLALARRSGRLLVAATAALAVSVYAYQIALVMTPVFALALVVPRRHSLLAIGPRPIALAGALGFAIALPYVITLLTVAEIGARARQISTFARGMDAASLQVFLANYAQNLGGDFLFVSGDPNLRHSFGRGELFLWSAPFVALGFAWLLLRMARDPLAFTAVSWVLLGPLPAALTDDGVPHAGRALLGIVAWPIVVAFGVAIAYRWTRPRRSSASLASRHMLVSRGPRWPVVAFVMALALAEVTGYYADVFGAYRVRSQDSWQYGTSETIAAVRELTPSGGVACIDTLSRFTFPHYVFFYLRDVPFRVVEGVTPECLGSGTVLALGLDAPRPPRGELVREIPDLAGHPVARVWRIP